LQPAGKKTGLYFYAERFRRNVQPGGKEEFCRMGNFQTGDMTVRKMVLRVGWAVVAVAGVALVVCAQGPPPGGGFGGWGLGPGRLMDGSFEFGGLMGGFGGKTVTGKPFQATFTITRTLNLPDNVISNTTTGTIARDTDGSTYSDVKLPAIGPWAASGKSPELVYIRNVTKMMQYFVNPTKKTYQASAIPQHNPPPSGSNMPKPAESANETVTDTPSTYMDSGTSYAVDDRVVTRTIRAGQIGNQSDIVITTERLYSADLDLVLKVTRTDPRFGTSTYQLSNIGQPASSLFTPDPSFQQVQGRGKFGHGGRGGAGKQPPPPPQD
jgi:hypothetical protein